VPKLNRRNYLGYFAYALSSRKFGHRSIAVVFAEWDTDRNCRRSTAGQIDYQERRPGAVRAGQMADEIKSGSQLWPALGSSNLPAACGGAFAHCLRTAAKQSEVPFRRHAAQSQERISAASWPGLGRIKKRQISIAGELWNFLRPAEYVVSGRVDYRQRSSAVRHIL